MKLFISICISTPLFVFAGICGTENYKCNADNQMYTRYFCSGDAGMQRAAFCNSSSSRDLNTCLGDNSEQTKICNREWSNRGQNTGGIQPGNATREEIVKKLGHCTYKTDSGTTKVSEIKNGSCGSKKYICIFEAKCERGASVTGQCFTDAGMCPGDPVDCIAVRDIVGKKGGTEAIDPNLRLNTGSKLPGAAR